MVPQHHAEEEGEIDLQRNRRRVQSFGEESDRLLCSHGPGRKGQNTSAGNSVQF